MTRPTFLVLGGFLAGEWETIWQRQNEWTAALQRRGNVLYLERAAAGNAGWDRAANRLRKLLRGRDSAVARPAAKTPFPPPPEFVSWLQLPANSERGHRDNALRSLKAAEARRRELGWEPFSLVHVGTPAEPWIEFGALEVAPVWFDSAERFLYSAAYERVDRDLMRRQVVQSALVTTDTDLTRSDWATLRDDIVVVEHGAKSWAAEPDWDVPRRSLYYVGSNHPALDVTLLRAIALCASSSVVLVGEYPDKFADESLELGGWTAGGDLPRRLSDAVAGLIPYQGGPWRQGVYPSKVYDYFLAGAPAVSTALPALDRLEYAWQIDTAEQAAEAIGRAARLSTDERHEIRSFALANTWETRFAQVVALLGEKGIDLDG